MQQEHQLEIALHALSDIACGATKTKEQLRELAHEALKAIVELRLLDTLTRT